MDNLGYLELQLLSALDAEVEEFDANHFEERLADRDIDKEVESEL